eukprot:7044694-Pyramimonas_sp.AAC.1
MVLDCTHADIKYAPLRSRRRYIISSRVNTSNHRIPNILDGEGYHLLLKRAQFGRSLLLILAARGAVSARQCFSTSMQVCKTN